MVDGTDETLCRKATFAFRPSARQERQLLGLLRACCEVYNAGLQERREAWNRSGITVTVVDQFKQVTQLRGIRDDILAWGTRPVRGALRRLDEAFAGFHRRVKAGQKPGFPRFRSHRRFDTACWDEPVCWKVDLDARILSIQGVGDIRLPRSAGHQLGRLAGRGGTPVTLTITRRRAGGRAERPRWVWRATVGFTNIVPERRTTSSPGSALVGADRGVAVTLAASTGQSYHMPSWTAEARERIAGWQRQRSGRTKYSRAWRQTNRRIAREHRKAAARSDNWARDTARALVEGAEVVVLENLNLPSMTASAAGTVDNPGRNVAAKAGLNRVLQDASLGRLARWVCIKAEEAGCRTWLVDPQGTSQQCARCGHTDRRNRPTRDQFRCTACGHRAHADLNAGETIAQRGRACETAWQEAGAPRLRRPTPRMRRRQTTPQPP